MNKSDNICLCGNLERLCESSKKPKDYQLTFDIFFDEKKDKYFISFNKGELFEIKCCWLCGGLELGDTISEVYIRRNNCNCEEYNKALEDEENPFSIDLNNSPAFVYYTGADGSFLGVMRFCPFCSGKLMQRTMLDC